MRSKRISPLRPMLRYAEVVGSTERPQLRSWNYKTHHKSGSTAAYFHRVGVSSGSVTRIHLTKLEMDGSLLPEFRIAMS